MTCDGNKNEYCGGPNRLDYYTGTATTPTTTAGGGASSTISVSGSGGATGIPASWKYDGCWVDNLDGRILGNQQPDNAELTAESCVNTCIGLGFTVAGMEYGFQCFCDKAIHNGGALAQNQGDCSTPCPGNSAEECGAGNRMNVYNTGTLTTVGIPVEQTGGISSWTYKGCRT
jgi:WSC domain